MNSYPSFTLDSSSKILGSTMWIPDLISYFSEDFFTILRVFKYSLLSKSPTNPKEPDRS